jgi:hypothetical protein
MVIGIFKSVLVALCNANQIKYQVLYKTQQQVPYFAPHICNEGSFEILETTFHVK